MEYLRWNQRHPKLCSCGGWHDWWYYCKNCFRPIGFHYHAPSCTNSTVKRQSRKHGIALMSGQTERRERKDCGQPVALYIRTIWDPKSRKMAKEKVSVYVLKSLHIYRHVHTHIEHWQTEKKSAWPYSKMILWPHVSILS